MIKKIRYLFFYKFQFHWEIQRQNFQSRPVRPSIVQVFCYWRPANAVISPWLAAGVDKKEAWESDTELEFRSYSFCPCSCSSFRFLLAMSHIGEALTLKLACALGASFAFGVGALRDAQLCEILSPLAEAVVPCAHVRDQVLPCGAVEVAHTSSCVVEVYSMHESDVVVSMCLINSDFQAIYSTFCSLSFSSPLPLVAVGHLLEPPIVFALLDDRESNLAQSHCKCHNQFHHHSDGLFCLIGHVSPSIFCGSRFDRHNRNYLRRL